MDTNIVLRNQHGETINGQIPLQTDSVEAQETVPVAPTLTYNGKAAAGAISVSSVALKPIIESLGSRVASFWGEKQNLVYSAFADGNSKKESSWLLSVTETASSAAITIYDPAKNLEEMFESVTGTVKRFVVKVYDKSGGTLYGWVRGISVSSNVYTFEIFNNRLTEGGQSWIGTLANFDNSNLEKVEIYFYNSSVSFGTGTCFTEEVQCPEEYSKNREKQLKFAETLLNGQYFIDYWRGEFIGVKADTTASEVLTYNVWSSEVTLSTPSGIVDDSAFTVGTSVVTPAGFLADETTPDSVDEGDIGAARITLDRKQIIASNFKEDSAHASADYGNFILAVRNDAGTALAGTTLDYIPLTTNSVGGVYMQETLVPNYELQAEGLAATHPAGMATSTKAITRFSSTALEASRVIKASAGRLYELMGRVDKTAPTADYWVLIMNAASLPADGAVTLLDHFKIVHTNGVDNFFDFNDPFGAYGSSGLVVCLSTTEFTKTISGAYLSITGKYA